MSLKPEWSTVYKCPDKSCGVFFLPKDLIIPDNIIPEHSRDGDNDNGPCGGSLGKPIEIRLEPVLTK